MKKRSENIDDQFKAMHETINKALEVKKEALMKMYRKDPRISRDDAVLTLNKMIEGFNATCINTQTVYCESFSDHSENVVISSSKRSLTYFGHGSWESWGYCFLKHPKTGNDTLLKWTLQVPSLNCFIGIVITSFINIFVYCI